jgi:hypothetical protein
MAAWNFYHAILEAMSAKEREQLKELLKSCEADLFAARSEDARVRLVEAFIGEAKTLLKK